MRLIISGQDIVLPRTTQHWVVWNPTSLRHRFVKYFKLDANFGTELVNSGHEIQRQSHFDVVSIIDQDGMNNFLDVALDLVCKPMRP